ncbi:MAG: hypothetical protein Fur0043_04700 [Anaerolineales bacterium]
MQFILKRFRQVQRRGILVESLAFVGLYIAFLLVIPSASPLRPAVENLAVLVSSLTGALLIFFSLSELTVSVRLAWLLLAMALLGFLASDLARTFYLFLSVGEQPFFSPADVFNFLAYVLAGLALLGYPFEGRYAPTRFRFLLDAVISGGVVLTLGWLLLERAAMTSPLDRLTVLSLAVYPLADLLLLIVLVNLALAGTMPRLTAGFLGAGLAAFALSDYAYSSLALLGSVRSGTLLSLGWVCGALLIGLGAVFERTAGRHVRTSRWGEPGLGAQIQKVLPLALVLVLFWYVLADWNLRGAFSPPGVWMSLSLGVLLVVRLGIRAGEVELQKYWQLFRNLADPAFICDLNGRVVLGNPAFEQLGVAVDENPVLAALFDGLPQDGLHSLLDAKHGGETKIEVRLRTSDAPYLLSLSRLVTEDRRALAAGAAYDLSEQKRQRDTIQSAYDELQALHRQLEALNVRLEDMVAERTANLQEAYQRLEEQNRALQALDRLKSDFVSMVSHELRNPLNNLGGGLELLMARRREGSADKAALALMQAEVRRLTRFVENILNVSALEAGRLVLRSVPLSLETVVQRTFENLSPQDVDGRLQSLLPPDLPSVLAAPDVLESVLGHLLDNALKYADGTLVQVCAERRGRRVRVSVRDFGPGIPPEKRGLLFERFQRLEAKDSQSVYGYGLGLYLSKKLLQAMGSDLSFDAPADGGARFSFDLKVAPK